MNAPTSPSRRYYSPGVRNALLTAHIVLSVGLLGDSAGFLAVAIRATNAVDPAILSERVSTLQMFGQMFGIPLSFGALFSGIALGLGTRWGVFRYPWVVTKLLLIVSVMVVGGTMIGPAISATLDRGAAANPSLVVAGAYDVLALAIATGLSVFKPGRPFQSRSTAQTAQAEATSSGR